jgi:hypothetical protein
MKIPIRGLKVGPESGPTLWISRCSHHDDEDELFLVVKGTMRMQFRDRDVTVHLGLGRVVVSGIDAPNMSVSLHGV